MTREQRSRASALLKIVRDSTVRFKDVSVAIAEGYALQFGCVSGSDSGAMGLHYVNGNLVNGGVIDPTRPQIVIYEPMPDGTLKLIGADYLVIAEAWHKKHVGNAGNDGTALSSVRSSQSFRTAGLLYAARLGVEGQPEWGLRELASAGLVRLVRGPKPLIPGSSRNSKGEPP